MPGLGGTLVTPPQQPLTNFPQLEEKNIILVKDLPINREIIHAILKDTGVHIDDAENGCMGVDMYLNGARAYDLILMDMQMPELDGLSATRQIRASGRTGAYSVPILAMKANAFQEDVENCLAAGAGRRSEWKRTMG